MADKHKLEWQNDKIVVTHDENGEHLITEIPTPFPLVVGEWNEKEHGTSYGVNDIEGKEVLLLTGAELCEHYEKLRLAYLEFKNKEQVKFGGMWQENPVELDFTNEFDQPKKD